MKTLKQYLSEYTLKELNGTGYIQAVEKYKQEQKEKTMSSDELLEKLLNEKSERIKNLEEQLFNKVNQITQMIEFMEQEKGILDEYIEWEEQQ